MRTVQQASLSGMQEMLQLAVADLVTLPEHQR